MPQFNNDEYLRSRVIEAYRALEDPPSELLPEEGSALRRTQIIMKNIDIAQKRQTQDEFQAYYKIARIWEEDLEHVWDRRHAEACKRALHQGIPLQSQRIALWIYGLFQFRPAALKRLTKIGPSAFHQLSQTAFEELKEEISVIQKDFDQLEQFLDL